MGARDKHSGLRFPFKRSLFERLTKAAYIGRRTRNQREPTRTLVVAQNRLMFDYIKPVWEIASTFESAIGYAYVPQELRTEAVRIGLTPLGSISAHTRSFDVILLANHAPSEFDPYAKRIRVPHGPVSAKSFAGESYYYGIDKLFWEGGRPVYDLMVDASAASINEALTSVPDYAGRIQLIGDMRSGMLKSRAQERTVTESPTVALMSTWGPYGLIEQHADWLLPEIAALAKGGSHRFVISAHPNIWDGVGVSRDWKSVLHALGREANVAVMTPQDDWAEYLGDCDIAISDHTSLAGSFAVTGKPVLPVLVPSEAVRSGTFYDLLCQAIAPLAPFQSLAARLDALIDGGVTEAAQGVYDTFVPATDQVRSKMQEALKPFFTFENL